MSNQKCWQDKVVSLVRMFKLIFAMGPDLIGFLICLNLKLIFWFHFSIFPIEIKLIEKKMVLARGLCHILPSLILANSDGRQNDLIHPPICIFIEFRTLDIYMKVTRTIKKVSIPLRTHLCTWVARLYVYKVLELVTKYGTNSF